MTDYSNKGNSSRLMLHVGAMLICCILIIVVILKGETGSYFAMSATVLFNIETDQGLYGYSGPVYSVVEMYGDVPPLSNASPLIFQTGASGDHGYSLTVQFPMEAVGKSLNYRIVLRSDNDYGGQADRISGTINLPGGRSTVILNQATIMSGKKEISHQHGQIVDLR
jgi:hypothetical protein